MCHPLFYIEWHIFLLKQYQMFLVIVYKAKEKHHEQNQDYYNREFVVCL